MAEQASQPEPRRVAAACRYCRNSKLKCSGTQPCERCQKRSRECVYEDKDERLAQLDRARISLPEHDTQARVERDSPPQTPTQPSNELSTPRRQTDESSSPRFLRNRPDKRRRWLYLGASSTWTFNVRVASVIRTHLKLDADDTSHSFTLDGDAYNISLKKASSDAQPDLSRLPSLDYAIYLVNTVKFQVGDILSLFDEDDFLHHLHEFYSKGPEKVGTHRLWYTQCLLLLALGKGFLNARKSFDKTSSAEFFSRAMSILPDVFALHEEPILAVERLFLCKCVPQLKTEPQRDYEEVALIRVSPLLMLVQPRLCAASQSSQFLAMACVGELLGFDHDRYNVTNLLTQIGQALRIALVEEHCRKLWWTVYILDRTLSSAVGAPVSVQDDHIRQPLGSPRQSSQRDATLIMHVKLCRVVSYILTELYTADGSLEHSYLNKTRSVLRRMAEIARELEDTIDFKFKTSLETLSKGALYLRLLYNQCMMLATRPLLLSLLQETLRSMSGEGRNTITVPSSIRDLLHTCVDSATKTLKTLWALNDHNLLDTFLPFNLEFACSAASVLTVTDDILRSISVSTSSKALIDKVLDEITAGGNKAAPLRQRELQQLRQLAKSLWTTRSTYSRAQQHSAANSDARRPHADTISNTVVGEASEPLTSRQQRVEDAVQTRPHLEHDQDVSFLVNTPEVASLSVTSSADFAQTFDFSQEQMLLLADHLDTDAISTMLDFGHHGLNEWF